MGKIYLAGGCFWCIEAVFKRIKGVIKVISGYAGGELKDPSYSRVSQGDTGHAETVEVVFDNKIVNLEEILDIFFSVHDPTTLNQQGHDIGTQYRSVIFYTEDKQRDIAEKFIDELSDLKVFDKKIVTKVEKLNKFYKAEDYHQNYFEKNPSSSYCQVVINPKIKKFE